MSDMMELEQAYVLHARPYRDTSAILDLLTLQHGRLHAVVRSVQSPNSLKRALIQPFIPLWVAWRGQHELVNLTHLESVKGTPYLNGKCLFTALYVNELLAKLLPKHDPVPDLFQHYEHVLQQISDVDRIDITLREFECHLLQVLGFAIEFMDSDGSELKEECHYDYEPLRGFVISKVTTSKTSYAGSALIKMANGDWEATTTRQCAKRLLRYALQWQLGKNRLNSSALFCQPQDNRVKLKPVSELG